MHDITHVITQAERPVNNSMSVVLVSSAPNRHTVWYKGDFRQLAVDPLGLQTESFKTNAVFLYQHDDETRPPIGRVSDIKLSAKKATGRIEFDPADDFAQMIRRKYEDGFMQAVSISYRPLKAELSKDGKVVRVTQSELREVSAVAIPADKNALKQALAALEEDEQALVVPEEGIDVFTQADMEMIGDILLGGR